MTPDEIGEALEPTGMCQADIVATVRHLVRADELGIHDQGASRVPWLLKRRLHTPPIPPPIKCEGLPYTDNTWKVSSVVPRIGYALMEAAVQYPYITNERWVAPQLVIVDNCFPSGALGVWARDLAERGYASVITATSRRMVPHPDGGRPFIGTAPISVCIPSPDDVPLVADMALTEHTYGDVLTGHATEDEVRFPNHKLWALGIALETMVRSMSFSQSAVLMLLFRPIVQSAVWDERRSVEHRLPGERR
jgi:LDH2 family malate/lactate/ureidoglycolate dehydrogenase